MLSGGSLAEDRDISGQLDAILKELQGIRQALERLPRPAAPQPRQMAVSVDGVPSLGASDAKLAVVEFTDYQCPFCKRFFEDSYRALVGAYVKPGKVRFYAMNLPVSSHPNALQAAVSASCAADAGRFWDMHDHMQANPDHLDADSLVAFAASIGIDEPGFRRCLKDAKKAEQIKKETEDAVAKGALGTPTFIVGKISGTLVEGEVLTGAVPLGEIEKALVRLSDTRGSVAPTAGSLVGAQTPSK
jgi:protein-disulfide isomerase